MKRLALILTLLAITLGEISGGITTQMLGVVSKKKSVPMALDSYTANLAGAWSVRRRLITSYTGSLIRIRRSNDDAEQDIGYTATGELDTAAITSFVGANSAYIRTVYDQVGSNNFGQAATCQPRIVNAGTLDTTNGHPALYSQNTRIGASALTGSAMTVYAAAKSSADPTSSYIGALMSNFGSAPDQDHAPFVDGNVYYGMGSDSRKFCGNPTPSLASDFLLTCVSESGNWILRYNSASFYSTASNTVGFGVPNVGGGASYAAEGWVSEWVHYSTAHTSTEWASIEPLFQP